MASAPKTRTTVAGGNDIAGTPSFWCVPCFLPMLYLVLATDAEYTKAKEFFIMSIKLMSAIFETEFRDLPYTKDGEDRKAKASTAKLLLLAIADHANDYGESAYPGYDKLEIKTALSRQGIADTLEALKQNGLVVIAEEKSRLNTNDYSINIMAFPKMSESSHLTNASQATLPAGVKPLDLNHPLTTTKPPIVLSEEEIQQVNSKVDAIIAGGQNPNNWKGRETFQPNDYPLVDWYHKVTGQDCPKSKQKDWHKAVQLWYTNNLTVKDLQAAYDMDIKWRGVFTSPNQLTDKAIALKAQPRKPDELQRNSMIRTIGQ